MEGLTYTNVKEKETNRKKDVEVFWRLDLMASP